MSRMRNFPTHGRSKDTVRGFDADFIILDRTPEEEEWIDNLSLEERENLMHLLEKHIAELRQSIANHENVEHELDNEMANMIQSQADHEKH